MPEIDRDTKQAEPPDVVRVETGFEPLAHYQQLRDQAPKFVNAG